MNWEGFLRSLASDVWIAVGIIFVLLVIYALFSYLIRKAEDNNLFINKDRKDALTVLRTTAFIVIVLVTVALFGRAASVGFANRMPRQDVDKNPVYEQMDSHGEGRR